MKVVAASQHKKKDKSDVCYDLLTIENNDSDQRGAYNLAE